MHDVSSCARHVRPVRYAICLYTGKHNTTKYCRANLRSCFGANPKHTLTDPDLCDGILLQAATLLQLGRLDVRWLQSFSARDHQPWQNLENGHGLPK